MPSSIKLSDRHILRLSGKDVKDFLQGLITTDIYKLSQTNAQWTGLLTPQGKYLFDFFLYPDHDDILLDIACHKTELLVEHFKKYILRADITIHNEREYCVYAFPENMDEEDLDKDLTFCEPRLDTLGYRKIIRSAPSAPLSEGNLQDYYHQLIQMGICDPSKDMEDTPFFWPEINAEKLNAIDYKKGCFVGQEVTARLKHKTEVKKQIKQITLMGSAKIGDNLSTDMMDIGKIVALSGNKGLAYIRLDRLKKAQETLRSITTGENCMVIISGRT